MCDIDSMRARLDAHEEPCDIQGVLRDARRIPLSYGRHMTGVHPVRPDIGPVEYESQLEARAISLFARFTELAGLRSQPLTLVYRSRGSMLRYTPDFHVSLTHVPDELALLGFERETLVEVKPWRRAAAQEAMLARKFSALRKATALPVVLLTDLDIPPFEVGGAHGY